MLYLLAAYTGLRASELASLTRASFDLSAKTVSVEAAYSKRRRNDTLPLHASLVERLRSWLAGKESILWCGTWFAHRCANTVRMLRSDLRRAGIAYRDAQGRVVDFTPCDTRLLLSLPEAVSTRPRPRNWPGIPRSR